ncbi:M20/M25/M40 family metallo-hydrolase [Metamycoplasma gateae]|uniref:M20/M25/M40 family metallo-hydrolase n=1 Tax=Metamycoplasma gateae TaxID=35769 RepID=A0ABZ2AH32_9BACT|nr:M20/M25/M40 family metallo-hydrolase [Metamycoplasma gateae]
MINHIANICKIPSISVEQLDNNLPFGSNANDALDFALNLAKSFNFETYKDSKNRYGFAQIGQGKKILGILVHLDVVPAGDEKQWKTSAFVPVIADDRIIARGSLDDKGPAIINMYAMKYILDNNLISNDWTIRIIFGISEETTMKSMKYYLEDFGHPDVSYTPDGEWPLIFAEKLIYQANFIFNKIDNFVINGGSVANQIPDKVTFSINDEVQTIYGISGHGSTPNKGENAIIKSINEILKNKGHFINFDLFKFIHNNFKNNDFSMPSVFKNFEDFSGKLTANIGIIKTNRNSHVITTDFRVPVSKSINDVSKAIQEYLTSNFNNVKFEVSGTKNAMFMPVDSKLVKLLIDTYNEGMKTNEIPIAIGGGTYARIVKNCVAFGSTKYMHVMHGPNEFFLFDEIKKSLEIYINTLIRIQEEL